VNDEDWLNNWKKYYKPFGIGKRIVIRPEWEEYDGIGKTVVTLNPGHVFGTGLHQSTQLCLEQLENIIRGGESVLDLGCGSGILGITALKLNAKSCEFFDLDPIAVDACRRNLNLNDLEAKVFYNDLFHNAESKGDILLINIVADVLIGFSKSIKNHLNNGGVIILSGIIKERKDDVISAYKEQGFKLDSTITKGEWVALSFRNL